MDINKDWKKIRVHFRKSIVSNLHVSIGSVDPENNPTVTPVGSFQLNKNETTGFYFEKYVSKLPQHGKTNNNICVLAVHSSYWFWFKSLFNVEFKSYPAIKLYGTLGERRLATEVEMKKFQNQLGVFKRLEGANYLWADMKYIREIKFNKAEKINLGKMTENL